MDTREIRLRCIEAAAHYPAVHHDGWAAGIELAANIWFNWIISETKAPEGHDTLHLPVKKK